ncbi:YIP1 family protein [Oceanicella sp. SM1341]|uniref:YIP1 family protein n=1 Tax=Oceanicella sp. SM1341 TaxID=1548889 RepID=UPI000E4A184D|nr:YIP1 family protein [Oceanicella sp. SM1341]
MSDRFSLGNVVWQSVTAPRSAARSILNAGFGWGVVGLIIATTVVIDVLVYQAVSFTLPTPDPETTDPALLTALQLPGLSPLGMALRVISVFVVSALVSGAGRVFRHPAPYLRIVTAVAWVGLVLAILGAVQALCFFALPPALLMLVEIAFSVVSIWVFASFVAEALGVERTGRVVAVTFVVTLAFALLAMLALGSPVTAPPGGS